MISILLTLSAKASWGVPFTQTGLCDLLLKTDGNLDEREKKNLNSISNKLPSPFLSCTKINHFQTWFVVLPCEHVYIVNFSYSVTTVSEITFIIFVLLYIYFFILYKVIHMQKIYI